MTLAAILFAYPPCQLRFIFADNLDTLIRAAAVDNDVFEVRVILRQDRLDRFLEEISVVEGGGDDGDFWKSSANSVTEMTLLAEGTRGGYVTSENITIPVEIIVALTVD